jgi:glycosyltransferase involved in cell wall biosynthesis
MARAIDLDGRTTEAEQAGERGSGRELDLLILGPVPPPFGGISIHLDRLVPLLQEAGLKVGVLNHFSSKARPFVVGTLERNPLRYFWLPRKIRTKIVHYHHVRWPHLVAVALGRRGRSARYIVTLHGRGILRFFPRAGSRVSPLAPVTKWALGCFDLVIVVNPDVASIIRDSLPGRRIEVIPAFVEPAARPGEVERYEPPLETLLGSGRALVVAAYGVQFLKDGRELYGLDLAVESFLQLAGERKNLRLALFVARRPARPKTRRHLAELEAKLAHAGLQDRVSVAFGQPLLPALRSNVVFLRPTRADGDALSIREAQQAGVPVVASDAVRRPAGVVVFPTEDRTALCAALRAVLDGDYPDVSPTAESRSSPAARPFSDRLIELYRAELAAQAGGRAH